MKLDKCIVVTGGDGFLGKHLVEILREHYTCVVSVNHVCYNLLDMEDARRLYAEMKPDILVHLAASVGGIQYNQANPAKLLYDNSIMGLNIIHQAKEYGNIEKVVCVGSVCQYAKYPTHIPFQETDIWVGYPEETNASYGISKRLLLQACLAYRKQYGLNAVFVIPTNMYGEGDSFGNNKAHVIPMLIKRCVEAKENNGKVMAIWGTGKATREFLYVKDCANALLNVILKYNKPEPLNIGNGKEVYIRDLAYMITEKVGYSGKLIFDATMPDGQPRRCLNVDNAYRELGWKAETTLDEGLNRTIEWYLNTRKGV